MHLASKREARGESVISRLGSLAKTEMESFPQANPSHISVKSESQILW